MTDKVPILTQRTYFRHFTPDDAVWMYALNNDPQVLRYTGDEPFANVAAASVFLAQYEDYGRYGMGRWAVISRQDGAFLGWCGLKYSPALEEYDIGFRFFRQYWNKGYATETARACLDFGFNVLNLQCIVGRARADNAPSLRVLEKLGMVFWETRWEAGTIWHVYHITAAHLKEKTSFPLKTAN